MYILFPYHKIGIKIFKKQGQIDLRNANLEERR